MKRVSILFNDENKNLQKFPDDAPEHFSDLNLDQVVDEITSGLHEYNLKPFYYFPLRKLTSIEYRQNIFRDFENETIYEPAKRFAEQMRLIRSYLEKVEKFYYEEQKEIWFLYAADVYCNSVKNFKEELTHSDVKSEGINKIKDFLTEYCSGKEFNSLAAEIEKINSELSTVRYQIVIQDTSFTVQNYNEGIDYSKVIEETFNKFRSGEVKDYKVKYESSSTEMNHIEAKILEFVSRLYPDVFVRLKNFSTNYKNFIDETILSYDREVHFYFSLIDYIKKLKQNGLKFCYPSVVSESKEIFNDNGFDLALAGKLFKEKKQIVCNDFYLKGKERVIVITGPNQGGKTTFARAFGQLHYLASLGCPVPGSRAQLFLADNIFTQFEKSEKVENLRGKLEDDLKRIYSILNKATPQSIFIMNEIFNSTTLDDMTFLSGKILEKINELDSLCVWVTFADELANFNEKMVSMTSMISPENPALRTFKIVRRPADGLAYAMAIVEKYKLRYDNVKERIKK